MRRRRFITFGSILAVVLSLVTVSYLFWFAVWHKREETDFSRTVFERQWGVDGIRIFDGNPLWVLWSVTEPCLKCKKAHEYWLDCDGLDFPYTVHLNSRLAARFVRGPIKYVEHAVGRRRGHDLRFEDWLPIPVLAAYPAVYFLVVGIWRLRRRPGHCLHCDYDLTENESGVCPECGTPVPAACVGNAIKESKIE